MKKQTSLTPFISYSLALVASVLSTLIYASDPLPKRVGPVPKTTNSVPHIQLDVERNPALAQSLLQRAAKIPGVIIRDTVISLPGAKGFWLDKGVSVANPQVIVGGREFAHMHPDGSLHASLEPSLAKQVVQAGWATFHPWSKKNKGWEGFVMIFTPTSEEELDVVYDLVVSSYEYVTGTEVE